MEDKEFRDSFNLNKVVRSITVDDGRVLVLLDDLHERAQQVPDVDPKTNKMKGFKSVRETVQSEIELNNEDAKKFIELTEYKG